MNPYISDYTSYRVWQASARFSTGYYASDGYHSWTRSLYRDMSSFFEKRGSYIKVTSVDKNVQLVEFDSEGNYLRSLGRFNTTSLEGTPKVETYVPKGHKLYLNIGLWESQQATNYKNDTYLNENLIVYQYDQLYTAPLNEFTGNLVNLQYATVSEGNHSYSFTAYGYIRGLYTALEANKTYTLTVKGVSTGIGIYVKLFPNSAYSSSSIVYSNRLPATGGSISFTLSKTARLLWLAPADTSTQSQDYTINITAIELIEGTHADGRFLPPITAVDSYSRKYLPLASTFDTSDRTPEILSMLQDQGYCELGDGDFYISNLVMPPSTTLKGQGDATRVYYLDDCGGCAINMKSRCNVESLTLYGSTDENYDTSNNSDKFLGSPNTDFTGDTDWWSDGNQTVPDTGFKHLVLSTPLPAGNYYIRVDNLTSSNPEVNACYIGFSTSQTTWIGTSNMMTSCTVGVGSNHGAYFTISKTAYSVRIRSASITSASEGYTAEWNGIHIYRVASRSAIGWIQESEENLYCGTISKCRIGRFSCAGILAMDTGLPINRGLTITDCYIDLCSVGVYLRRDCEYNKVIGCTMFRNYFGVLCRGGNNIVDACIVSGNYINIQNDADEGSNTGHGMITSCKIHHSGYSANDSYAIIIKNTGRIPITGCVIGDKILLDHTNGNIVSSNNMFDVDIEVNAGQCSIISDCIFRSGTITRIDNTSAVVHNCYTRSGTPITWSD